MGDNGLLFLGDATQASDVPGQPDHRRQPAGRQGSDGRRGRLRRDLGRQPERQPAGLRASTPAATSAPAWRTTSWARSPSPANTLLADFIFGTNPLYTTDTMYATAEVYVVPSGATTGQYQQQAIPALPINNGAVSGQFLVNVVADGSDGAPSVGMDATGDAVIAWSGAGQSTDQGIFSQRYAQPSDTEGPTVGQVLAPSGSQSLVTIADESSLSAGPTQLVVTFDKPLSTRQHRRRQQRLNLANWSLTVGGVAGGRYRQRAVRSTRPTTSAWRPRRTASMKPSSPSYPHTAPGTLGATSLSILDAVEDTVRQQARRRLQRQPRRELQSGRSRSPAAAAPPAARQRHRAGQSPRHDHHRPASQHRARHGRHAPGRGHGPRRRLRRGLDLELQRQRGPSKPSSSTSTVSRCGRNSRSTSAPAPTSTAGNDNQPAVAMDAYGDFVVVWAGEGPTDTRRHLCPRVQRQRHARRRSVPWSTKARRDPARSPAWPWTPTAISSSPGAATARPPIPQRRRLRPAIQHARRGPEQRLPGEHLPAELSPKLLGHHGRQRRLCHRLARQRRGRQQLGRLRTTVQCFERQGGRRVPGEHLHPRPAGQSGRGHGCQWRFRCHLAELQRGYRHRLRRLRPPLQLRRHGHKRRDARQSEHDFRLEG